MDNNGASVPSPKTPNSHHQLYSTWESGWMATKFGTRPTNLSANKTALPQSIVEGLAMSTSLFDSAADSISEKRTSPRRSWAKDDVFDKAAGGLQQSAEVQVKTDQTGSPYLTGTRYHRRRTRADTLESGHKNDTEKHDGALLGYPSAEEDDLRDSPSRLVSGSTYSATPGGKVGGIKSLTLFRWCRRVLLKGEGWVFTALAAVLTGCSAVWIELVVRFLSDVRLGICQGVLALDRDFCCGRRSAVDVHHNRCKVSEAPVAHMNGVSHPMWLSWSTLLAVDYLPLAYLVDYMVYIGIGVAFATLSAWLCSKFSRAATGSGIPEVKAILGGYWISGFLGPWTAIIKCVGLCLAVASGLSLGKEGPLVHVACCWAIFVAGFSLRYATSEAKRRELLSAASAVGVSVAFGAPLGGVLFSLEEVSSYFPPKTLWKSFFGAVIGALSLKWFDTGGTGRLTLFEMDSVSLLGTWQIQELIPFAILGLLGGAIGTLFIKLNLYWATEKRRLPLISQNPIFEVLLVAIVTSIINYPFPMLRVTSSTLLEQMFNRCGVTTSDPDMFRLCSSRSDPEYEYSDYALSWSILFQLLFSATVRFLEACFTFGIGLPAGLFLPSLTVGALCGRCIGLLTIKLNKLLGFVNCHKCLHPGVYAIVGAAAVMGGTTRVTISLVVIMFELTGGLSYVLPFMVAVMVAKWVADALGEASIYDRYIRLKQYPYLRHDEQLKHTSKAADVMDADVKRISLEGNTLQSLQDLLSQHAASVYPVITCDDEPFFVGYIVAHQLKEALQHKAINRETTNNELSTSRKAMPVIFDDTECRLYPPKNVSGTRRRTVPVIKYTLETQNTCIELTSIVTKPCSIPTASPVSDQRFYCLDLTSLIHKQPFHVAPEAPLHQVYLLFKHLDIRVCCITHHGRLEGVITQQRLLEYLDAHRAN